MTPGLIPQARLYCPPTVKPHADPEGINQLEKDLDISCCHFRFRHAAEYADEPYLTSQTLLPHVPRVDPIEGGSQPGTLFAA
jgi:hypothetical protein